MGFFTSSFSFVAKAGTLLTRPLVSGDGSIGLTVRGKTVNTLGAVGMILDFRGNNKTQEFNLGTCLAASSTAPSAQVESVGVIGTITVAGSLLVTVTSSLLVSPVVVTLENVPTGTVAASIAIRIRNALLEDAKIVEHFNVSVVGSNIIFRVKVATDGDSSLNIAFENGTAVGMNNVPISTISSPGLGGIIVTGGDGKDLQGNPQQTGLSPSLIVFHNTGNKSVILKGAVVNGAGVGQLVIAAGNMLALGGGLVVDSKWHADLTLTSTGSTIVNILRYGID